jgi:hypothetical protein
METEEIELTDKSTGEIYCIWYQNGARQEQKGRCQDIFGASDVPADTSTPPPTDASTTIESNTTSTPSEPTAEDNTSTTTGTVAIEQEPVTQTDTVEEPTPEAVPTETPASVRQPADSVEATPSQ